MFTIDQEYAVKIRRQLHMYPEIGFDLPKTTALIKQELEDMGIPYTEQYGEASVVGYINPQCKGVTIGIRADTDALEILEKNDVPYRSQIEGKMHACGHDAHTAMLLCVGKALKGMENTLNCRVLLIFQPSEEGFNSGAAMMVKNGLMKEVDMIVAQHVVVGLPVGEISIAPSYLNACSRHFTIEIFGKSAHAAAPHTGIDAAAIAMRIYNAIQLISSREISPNQNFVCSIGRIEAGTSHNIVAGYAMMKGTIRTFDLKLSAFIFERIQKICKCMAEETGAEIKVYGPLKSTCVYNNPYVTELMRNSMEKVIGKDAIRTSARSYGSEDFSRFGDEKPAVMFRLGVGNQEKGYTASVHHDNFMMDEEALQIGAKTMVQFVIDNQNSFDAQKAAEADERN